MAPPIRLLYVSQPPIAGVPRVVRDLISHLDLDRYEVDVACARGSDLWNGLGDGRVRLHQIDRARRPAPLDVLSLGRLLPLVRRADVIHAHSAKAGFLARLAALFVGRRQSLVFSPHGWSFWAFGGGERRLYLRLERIAARWCRTIVTVSGHERDAGLAAGIGGPDQYSVIPNGIDVERFALPREPVRGRVVMVARLVPQKRPDLAVRAFARLRQARPEAELHLVGDGPRRAEIERLILDLGLRGSVHLLGDRDDVPELLSRAACMLLATHYEGCSISVLEGMAAGLPVVATTVGGMDELIDDGRTGFLVDAEPDAIARALEELLADPARAAAMGAAAQAEVRSRFTRERMARDTCEIYEEIAAERPSG